MEGNLSTVTEFIFLAFLYLQHLQLLLFVLVSLIYFIILIGNSLIVAVTSNLLSECQTISFLGCATQMYFFLLFGNSECCLLALMSYDRYVAICNPMRYSLIMSRKVTIRLASVVWIAGNVVAFEQTVTMFMLSFYGSNKIEHFFCDVIPVLKLASTDTSLNDVINTVLTVVFIIFPFVLIITSYICIFSTILKMRSAEGRHKAFSTCSSHLITVTLFFGSGFITYMRPSSSGCMDTNRAISLFYTVITPMFNPIIYSLRNKEVKEALRKILGSSRTS
ncbi:olfactory receptor 10A7-like [Gopherus evgoodei]|uniref:olfactory receptor 10A7-like n=1 Tax=Gopherus evgoodei TaxID=1825980 RepID=UPI0011CF9E6F|nr:olfactory receptor 10A7-like [Gopherus evgoodei]